MDIGFQKKNYKISFLFSLILSVLLACKQEALPQKKIGVITETFKFSTISQNPIVDVKKESRDQVINRFKGINVLINSKDKTFQAGKECTFEYFEKKVNPIKYWYSQSTVNIYKEELVKIGISLPKEFSVFMSANPNKTCEYPTSEYIFIDGKIIFIYEGYLVVFENNKQSSSKSNSLITENNPTKLNLPFSFYQYFKEQYSDAKYPSYEITSTLIDYLKSKNYDGESYKAFVLHSDNQFQYLVVDMSRGDSDYFILITAQNDKIIDSQEIGSIGDENPITFKVSPDFIIEKYKGNTPDAVPFEKLKIDKNGKILRL